MIPTRVVLGVCLVAGIFSFIEPAVGETYPVILRGKVVTPDGTPPPIIVGIERICSTGSGSKPGPLTNKQGEYIWRMDVDPMNPRSCVIQATHAGYVSTTIDISALNGYLDPNIYLDPIIITSLTDDPYAINLPVSKTPDSARSKVKAAMKALDIPDYPEARRQFQAAVEAAPKFAGGWHALGVLLERNSSLKEARQAYEHAIESNPKLLPPYMTLARLCIKTKEWECAVKTADALIKVDTKHLYPAIYMHRAVAQFGLKDLENAAASGKEALRLDPYHRTPRAEYVYGRILEAKGDLDGAREHMSKYLELDKNAPDSESIRRHLENLGKKEANVEEPELEFL